MDLLIGYSGFVGINLVKNMKSNTLFVNSKNSDQIINSYFDTVYCCGVYAEKWKANKFPQDDNDHINDLMIKLSKIRCNRFILISTVDVLDCSVEQYENSDSDSYYNTLKYSSHTYGINRRRLEEFCINQFSSCFIFRLPALYGTGLKKNALWDLINNNNIDKLRGHWKFQWYNIDWLYEDIQEIIRTSKYRLIHLLTPTLKLNTIQKLFFPDIHLSNEEDLIVNYNIKSSFFNKRTLEDVLLSMKSYINTCKKNSNLLVSELAWKLESNNIMKTWLKSRSITEMEAVPSKNNWNMTEYTDIYSAQSILYNININIFKEKERFLNILEEKLKILESKNTKLIVFGSPTQRDYNGEDIDNFFIEIANLSKNYNILFCLENNASAYKCNWMTKIEDTINFVKKINHSHMKVNLDIGSIIMENEEYKLKEDDIPYIGHVQISFPNLSNWDSKYEPIIKQYLVDLYKYNYSGKVSLEMKPCQNLPFKDIESFIDLTNSL